MLPINRAISNLAHSRLGIKFYLSFTSNPVAVTFGSDLIDLLRDRKEDSTSTSNKKGEEKEEEKRKRKKNMPTSIRIPGSYVW
ncbi:hypothetical protein EYC84_007380 [Monilinia fructicola]|uniref:Uncharacterized protein n=1 Tax=Monilinia fructicola TaxID=38448 RepID=A0A5M9JG40_MONFR|nr:hypothetical protein EYC84_007380 [Monilinia fructicola]